MTFRVRAGVRLLFVALAFTCACGGRTVPSASETELTPDDLYPLREGNAWSYDVDTGAAKTTLAITKVLRFDGSIAEVQTGSARVQYELSEQGIRVPPEDVWLLRAPIREGASWPARAGRLARLVAERLSVETPAGTFHGCVEVLETGGKLDLEVRTVFCPGVGPVSLRSTMRSERADRSVSVSARLRGYQVSPASPDR